MVILTPITINNHFNNANYVTKVDHLCSERHTFNFLLKKVDFRGIRNDNVDMICHVMYNTENDKNRTALGIGAFCFCLLQSVKNKALNMIRRVENG